MTHTSWTNNKVRVDDNNDMAVSLLFQQQLFMNHLGETVTSFCHNVVPLRSAQVLDKDLQQFSQKPVVVVVVAVVVVAVVVAVVVVVVLVVVAAAVVMVNVVAVVSAAVAVVVAVAAAVAIAIDVAN